MRPILRHEREPAKTVDGVAYYPNFRTRLAMRQADRISKRWSAVHRHRVVPRDQSKELRYDVFESAGFRKEVGKMRKRGMDRDALEDTIGMLARGEPLPLDKDDHRLDNPLHMHRVCRIGTGFYLVYSPKEDRLILRRIWTEGVMEKAGNGHGHRAMFETPYKTYPGSP